MHPTRPSATQRRALTVACVWFCIVGLLLAVAGSSALFAPWRHAASAALFGQPRLPETLLPFVAFTDGIVGGSIVGKWLAALWLVRHPVAEGQRWAHRALVAGLLSWFVVDSGMSLYLGAAFNVWMINLAPTVVFGGLLLWVRPRCQQLSAPPATPSRAWTVTTWICAWFVMVGLMVAVANHSILFAVYHEQIATTWFGGTLPATAITWLRFSFALVGATFLAHFVMLALIMRHAVGERWALNAVAISMLGWFLVDSVMCIVHGGWFNVGTINVPSLVAVAVPWWFAWRRDPSGKQAQLS